MSNIISNIKDGKYKRIYNVFLIIFIGVFVVRTTMILSSPKPYLLTKNVNKNNIIDENSGKDDEVIKVVNFKDKNFEYKIRSVLGVFDREILNKDLKKITSIDLNHNNVKDLEGIQYCINLKNINLSFNKLSDIKNLKNLNKLEVINLFHNSIENIDSLRELKNLKKVDLAHNNIKDVTPLKNLSKIKEVDLYSNNIKNIDSLKKLTNLELLDVSRNHIKDIKLLKDMKIKKILYWGNDN